MPHLVLDNITKNFEDTAFGICPTFLSLERGERLALIGLDGSGKTSLLKIIAGVFKPDSGVVFYNNSPNFSIKPKELNVGMLFEDFSLFTLKSVRANIAYPLKLRGVARSQIKQRVDQAVSLFCLEKIIDKRALHLSELDKHLAAMARLYARSPDLILIDQPYQGLSGADKTEYLVNLKKLFSSTEATIIAAFTSVKEAQAFCPKAAVIHLGAIHQISSYDMLRQNPATPFVKSLFE